MREFLQHPINSTHDQTPMRTMDYLERPPNMEPERQATRDDGMYSMSKMMEHYLRDIRNELCKQVPTVLCVTQVQGGNVLPDTNPRVVKFLLGGKAVKVYGVTYWSQSAKTVRLTPAGMATAADGFTITNFLGALSQVELSEVSIALSAAGTVGVNVPSGINADGSVFIYGWTIPDQIQYEEDY